ncbi:MAG: TonB-dependent siderophore receptor [Hyphomonadaceae bacterium]
MKVHTIGRALVASASIVALSNEIAMAQEAGVGDQDDAVTSLDTVVVVGERGFLAAGAQSASKANIPLKELPRTVSVVTEDEIRNRGADTLTQIFQYTPSFSGDSYGANSLSRSYSNVRGFLSYQYLDGMKLHDSNWGIEPYGLERAELFKGPGSALYGQASPGGVIALSSKRPTDERMGEIALQAGDNDRLQGAFDLAGPLSQDGALKYRLTGLARTAETNVRFQKDDRYYFAPALGWSLDENTELTVLASWQSDPNLTVFQYLPRVGTLEHGPGGYIPQDTFTGEPDFDDLSIERGQIAVIFDHRFSDRFALRQAVRYTDLDITAKYLQATGVGADQRTASRLAVNSNYAIELTQTDTQLTYRANTAGLEHNFLLGLDYVTIPTSQGVGTGAGGTIDLYDPVYGAALAMPDIAQIRYQDFEQTGLYLQDHIKIERLSILLGLRRDWASSETSRLLTSTNVLGAKTIQDDEATTGQIGVIYEVGAGVSPYVSWSNSFQPTAGTDFGGNPFVPSTGEQGEIGVKFAPKGLNALFTIAAFELVQQNVRTADPVNAGYLVQTGEVRSRGIELEAKASLRFGLNLAAGYTSLEHEVTQSNSGDVGTTPAGRPEHQASFWADYAVPGVPGLTVGAGARYVGSSFGDRANTFKVPSYTLYDALIRYDFSRAIPAMKGWDIALNAQNLGDERYVANCDAATQCFYGAGRVAKVTLRRSW